MSRSSRASRRALAAASVLLLSSAGVLASASIAAAADADVFTEGWQWNAVDDRAAYIDDAESYTEGYLGTSLNIYGFTSDAFDGFMSTSLVVIDGPTSIPLLSADWTAVPGSWVNFGRSSFEAEAMANFGDGNILTITRTLEIEGSYARWTWDVENAGAEPVSSYTLVAIGTLGSGTLTEKAGGADTFVTYETNGFDPVIGHRYLGVGPFSVDVIDGQVEFIFNGAGARLDMALLEFDPCSRQDAVDEMLSLLPTLATDFGTVLDPVYADDCLYVADPAPISGATNQLLPLVQNTGLDTWNYLKPTSIDDGLTFEVLNAPTGLTFALENDPNTGLPALRMTGNPAASGDVSLLMYFGSESGPERYPLVVTFEVERALAATGSEPPSNALVTVGLLLFAGMTLLLVSRRSRRSAA